MRFESCGQAKSSEFDTKEDARLLERDVHQNEILMEDQAQCTRSCWQELCQGCGQPAHHQVLINFLKRF